MSSSTALAETLEPCDRPLALDVLSGLAQPQKRLSSRFLYDARGSDLFEEITELSAYYPTRTEIGLLEQHADAIAAEIGPNASIVEFGSGSGRKIGILLHALERPRAWLPIDIAGEALSQSVKDLRSQFPDLDLVPIHADFTQPVVLPPVNSTENRVGFFPGSTIGNFEPRDALGFLGSVGTTLGAGAAMVIGVDLKKDLSTLLHAYDDPAGVTAAFNLNLLVRINRELGADFDLDGFIHEARYRKDHGRIEMHLVSRTAQAVNVLGKRFHFEPGESIHTENSCKYTVDEFWLLARASGWRPVQVWTDPEPWFSVHLLRFEPEDRVVSLQAN
ncbi:MAG: L-histidine N(alpha)-methyltransferase [Pseudomonadota bacterium]